MASITMTTKTTTAVPNSTRRARWPVTLDGAVEELCMVEKAMMSRIVPMAGQDGLERESFATPRIQVLLRRLHVRALVARQVAVHEERRFTLCTLVVALL